MTSCLSWKPRWIFAKAELLEQLEPNYEAGVLAIAAAAAAIVDAS
jgi:hypothetical protein